MAVLAGIFVLLYAGNVWKQDTDAKNAKLKSVVDAANRKAAGRGGGAAAAPITAGSAAVPASAPAAGGGTNNLRLEYLRATVRSLEANAAQKRLERNRNVKWYGACGTIQKGKMREHCQQKHSPLMWRFFVPYWPCLWTQRKYPMVQADGGKWTCGVPELVAKKKTLVVYSFGSRADDKFERAIKTAYPNAEVHIFDPTSQAGAGWDKLYTFHKLGLGGVDDPKGLKLGARSFPLKTMGTIMQDLGHKHVDILKMDIEGSEYAMLRQWGADGAPNVGQLMIEMHGWTMNPMFSSSAEQTSGLKLNITSLHTAFKTLEDEGFRLYNADFASTSGCPGCSSEVAFIHNSTLI